MIPYIFVGATIFAIIPILIIFKILIGKVKENPNQTSMFLSHFLVGAALSETIPIILIIYGFVNLTPVDHIDDLYMPAIIILLTIGAAIFFILLQKSVDTDDRNKASVNQFIILSLALTFAIPFISIIALMLMIP